ncbi:ciliogenesis and planar polarity effector 1-like isoform X2 [Ptychodera flava]|uniref:ciliogenesis and planar polarity effector 1-like isoform X2 n=1 Tax=Ptychodera flava TaxID=63121 RepID=UPI00396A2B0C
MHIKLEVLASTNIKRKKPWPRLGWLGQENESLFLMDNRRLSILYVPSGKTKKKIPKVHPHLESAVVSSSSQNGQFFVGLQHSGNLFLWNRDRDLVRTITGLPDLATHVVVKDKDSKEPDTPKPLLFISNNGDKILVVIGHRRLFLWEVDQPARVLGLLQKQTELKGSWCHISPERDVRLPTDHTKEISIDARFFVDSVLGDCCVCSYTFNVGDKMNITSVLLRWLEPADIKTKKRETFIVEWNSFQTPLTQLVQGCRPIFSRGVYASSHAHNGLTLAVAANQRSPHDNRILFVSLLTSMAQVSDLKGCGTKVRNPPAKLARTYWIADMKWTADDLFLVCITKMGSVVMLTRLGEPLRIESAGCSVELGPDYFLQFHPLITISTKKDKESEIEARHLEQPSPTSSLLSDTGDIMKQRFSIATHPSLPIFLCSDGYMVTVMQLPDDTSCAGLMKTLLAEVRIKLNKVSEQYNLPLAAIPTFKFDQTLGSLQDDRERVKFQFESPQETMGMSTESSLSPTEFLGINQMDEGKIYFGDDGEQMSQTGSSLGRTRDSEASAKILHSSQMSLLAAWSLGVSYSDIWTKQLDTIMSITVDCMVKVCEMTLKTDSSKKSGPVPPLQSGLLERVYKLMTTSPDLYKILITFQQAMSVLRWDTIHQNASTYAFKLILGMVQTLLQSDTSLSYAAVVTCTYHILLFSEQSINTTYTWLPRALHVDSLAEDIEFHLADSVESTVLCQGVKRKRLPSKDPDEFNLDEQLSARSQRGSISARSLRESLQELRMGMDIEKIEAENTVSVRHTPAKRLMLSWKMLYRQLLQYLTKLEQRLVRASADTGGSLDVQLVIKKQRMVLLLCATQLKLSDLGFDVTEDKTWKSNANKMFLKGAMYYEASNFARAIDIWREVALGSSEIQEKVSPVLETQSLLAVLYTQLQQYNLMGALQLADSLIDCYTEIPEAGGQKTQKEIRLSRSDSSFLSVFTNMLGVQEAVPTLPVVNSDSVRPVVQSLARFMALYFSNKPIYIYPPHSPMPLPPLHRDTMHACRVIPLYHEAVSYSIRQQDLSEIWTSDRALQLLLVAGMLPEAIWFSKELGDWKSAFVLGVTYVKYKQISIWKDQENGHSSEELPEELHPFTIVQSGLEHLIQIKLPGIALKPEDVKSPGGGLLRPPSPVALKKSPSVTSLASMGSFNVDEDSNIEHLSKTVTNMLKAAVISGLDATPWLLGKLSDRCQSLVSELHGLVPEGLYLPAPPLYCPQPATASTARIQAFVNGTHTQNKLYQIKTEETEDVVEERQSRHDIANTIQLMLLVLNASNCTLACTKWYVEQLIHLQDTEIAAQRDDDVSFIVEVPHTLAAHTKYPVDLLQATRGSRTSAESVAQILNCFRDLCSITWLLHVRDKFCTCARKYQASREKSTEYKTHETPESGESLDLLLEALKWALCLLPFTQYLDLEAEMQDIVLTLISELPRNKNTASILAEHFYHADIISPAVEEKYQRLVEVMKSTFIASPSTASRSMDDGKQSKKGKRKLPPQPEPLMGYFDQRCADKQRDIELMNQRYRKLETQIFVGKGQTSAGFPIVGSREFERSELFLEFLDTFFLVSFNKQTSAQINTTDLKDILPLLLPYSEEIKQQELTSVPHKVMKSFHKRHGISPQSPVLSRSQSYQDISPRMKQDFIEIRKSKDQDARSPSPKRHIGGLFRSRSYSESLVQKNKPVLQVVHKRYGSQGSIDPDKALKRTYSGENAKGAGFPVRRQPSVESLPTDITSIRRDTLRRRSSSLTDVVGTGSEVFVNAGLSHGFSPYANINVNLDPKYDDVSQLMEWLTRWTGKHHMMMQRKQSASSVPDSGIGVMRVNLPLQLVHNCLWLTDNKYLPPISNDARKRTPAILEEDTDITISPEDAAVAKAKAKASRREQKEKKKRDKKKDTTKKKKKKKAKTDEKHVEITETAHVMGESRREKIQVQRAKRHLDFPAEERMESPFTRSRSPAETDITEDITAVSPLPTASSPFPTQADQLRRSATPDDALSRVTPLFSEPLDSQVDPRKLSFATSDGRTGDAQGRVVEDDFSSSSTSAVSVSSMNDEDISRSAFSEPDPHMRTVEEVEIAKRRQGHAAGSPSGDIRKMVRFELKKIMAAQQQNIMQLLDSSGTTDFDSHDLDISSSDRMSRSDKPVRDRSGRRRSSKDASHAHVDVQVAPTQMNVDTQTGQTLKLLGEGQIPDIRVYGPQSHPSEMEPTRDVPHGGGHPYYPGSMGPQFMPGYDMFTPRDQMYSSRSYHEPVLEHGMPLLRLPPEAQEHLRMPRARPFIQREAWGNPPPDVQSGKDFFSRPELRRYQDDVKARQELDQYASDGIKGNIHGKKFFSVADESEQSHERQHVEDREAKLRAQIGKYTHAPGPQQEPPAGVPLLKVDPGHGYVRSGLFGHYYKASEDRENIRLPHLDDNQAPPPASEKNAPQESNSHGFPLLHMNGDFYKPFRSHGGNGYHGIPRLIPPELIIDYEQQKYHKEFAKYRGIYKQNIKNANIRDWQSKLAFGQPGIAPDKTGKEYYANADDLGPVQLLHADLDPFEPEGDRNNITRRRRRRQKEKEQKSPKADESESKSKTEPVSQRPATKTKEEEEASEDDLQGLGRGYVIPPGSYDSELQKKRDISIYPTPAEIHYNAISNKEAKPRDHSKRQDVATSMETNGLEPNKNVRFAEPEKSDQPTAAGAISQYAEAATGIAQNGNIIAPDIFFSLRFGRSRERQADTPDEPEQQPTAEKTGRDFINVVDIDSKILESIPDKEEAAKVPAQQRRSPRRSPGETEPTIAELHYRALRDRDVDSRISPLPEPGPDGLTVSILDGGIQPEGIAMLPRVRMSHAERDRAKHNMSEKLIEMNDQLNAIDTMARNMEREFKDANLLLHTVDQMAEAIAPEDESRPKTYYTSRESPAEKKPSPVPDAREMGDIDITTRPSKRESEEEFTPEDSLEVKKGREERRRLDSARAPKEGEGLPSVSVPTTRADENLLHISGLSGVSDIIAEVIADEDVDTTELGITEEQKQAARQHVQDRQEGELWEYTRLSNQELKEMFHPSAKKTGAQEEEPGLASVQPSRRSVEDREELRKWMAKKKTKHMDEYKKQLQERRQSEREPYKPPDEQEFKPMSSLKEIKKAEDTRHNLKRTREEEYVGERVRDAVKLMGDILSDKPELHKESAISTSRTQHSYSPGGTGRKQPGPTTESVTRKDRAKEREELEKVKKARKLLYSEAARLAGEERQRPLQRAFDEHDRTIVHADEYARMRDSREKDKEYGKIPKSTYRVGDTKPYGRESYLPERSGEIHRSTDTDSTGMATAYTRHLERQLASDLEKTATLDRIPEGSENKENEPVEKKEKRIDEDTYVYKPKPYTQLVKVQRPEVTRKQQKSPRAVKTYSERLAELKTTPTKRTSESVKAKQRLYGTKRIPSTQKTPPESKPSRVVKSYTERLAEMKKASEAETRYYRRRYRAARRQDLQRVAGTGTAMPVETDRMSQLTARGMRSDATPRSGISYTDRLKELSNAGTYRGREGVVSPSPAVGVHYREKTKTPSTYVERLQNAPKAAPVKHKTVYVGPPRTILKSPSIRSQPPRSRPYASPYRPVTAEDILDEVSEISADSQWTVPDDVKRLLERDDTTFTAASEYSGLSLSDMDYIEGVGYTSAVDIKELEEIASIGSESIISDIDWNAIENMIADVK